LPHDYSNPGVGQHLAELRRNIFAGTDIGMAETVFSLFLCPMFIRHDKRL